VATRHFLLLAPLLAACATVPPESVLLSQQVERNLQVLKANNLSLLNAWRDLSLDYWTDKVARNGPDIILQKARAEGKAFDLTKDYEDLVKAVLDQYRANFVNKIDAAYANYLRQSNSDYAQTQDAVRRLTALLQSVAKLDAERQQVFLSAAKDLQLDDSASKVQGELKDAFK
jgi:hypothetical protein